ncbi:MAG: Ig-like domain-containing protein, partial [Oscillospiraceae bacterium]|nr:Ig-like domain-containing protein [Oscillospiraceae bacterium]
MKKLISFALVFAMLFSLAAPVYAAEDFAISMTADKTRIAAGETVTLTVSANKTVENVGGFQYQVFYDPALVAYTGGANGTAYDGTVIDHFAEGSYVQFLGLDNVNVEPFTLTAGVVGTLTFTAKEDVKTDDVISFTLRSQSMVDFDGAAIALTVPSEPTTITVSAPVAEEPTLPFTASLNGETLPVQITGETEACGSGTAAKLTLTVPYGTESLTLSNTAGCYIYANHDGMVADGDSAGDYTVAIDCSFFCVEADSHYHLYIVEAACGHSWTDGVCTVCGEICPHETYADGKCALCGKEEDTPSDDSGSSSVTVTLSLSADDKFMVGPDTGEIMAFKNITVPYFDLANYGLEEYYFVSESYDDDGDGLPGSNLEPGTAEYAEGKVTLLHLYLYALEVFYCGVEPHEAGQGYLYNEGLIGTDVFSISGSVGSSFLNQFWGGDCNLNYYVNYKYPLASEGWGATSDQILLRDGDMITLGHFTSWSFYSDPYSIFNYITADKAAPAQGDEVTLTLYYAGPNMGTSSDTAQNLNTYCVDVYCTPVDSLASEDVTEWERLGTSDENGQLVVDTSNLEPGKYIVAVPGQYGADITDEICSTPGGMILTVTAAAEEEECKHTFANGSCTLCGKPDPNFIAIESMTLSSASTESGALALVAGGSEKLNLTVTPANATQGYSWSSDNEAVATVNNGIVTAVGAGTATITVTAGDAATFAARSTPVTASVTVTVTEPAAGYTVKMPGDATVNAGQTIDIPVTLGSTDNAAYNAFDITVTYPAGLTLTTTELDGLDVTAGEGSVRIKGYGEARDAGTAPFTLRFEATAVGEHSVTVTAAKVDNSTGAIAADAPDAALIDAVTVITVAGYNVSLPEDFTGKSVAAPKEAYSFAPPADNYNYTVTDTVGGEEVEVTPNDDGSYTIPAEKVTGEIVVTMERTGKEYSVTFTGEDMTGNPKAYYDADYSATLSPVTGYNYAVSIKINGEPYSGHSVANNVYTIPGKDITG